MKMLVIDGNSILNRAFYGIKILTTKDGRFTNGIYGFLTILLRLREEIQPDAVAIAFDRPEPTFRHGMYGGYKAQRKGMPPELAQQLPVLKELLGYLGYKILEKPGFEADDILGTLAQKCGEIADVVIATGDRDSLQLVTDCVNVFLASTAMGRPVTVRYTVDKIKEEYGVEPAQLIEIKALMGDSSDNIPGVAGVGQKTASDLISRFGSIDRIYEGLDTIDIKPALRDKLTAGRDMAFLSRELGTINKDVPVETAPEVFIPSEPDSYRVTRLMADLEMFKLLERFDLKEEPIPVHKKENNETKALGFTVENDLFGLLERLKKEHAAVFTVKYAGSAPVGLYFAFDDEVVSAPASDDDFSVFLKSFAGDESIQKTTHDMKTFAACCLREGAVLKGRLGDVMLAGYILNPNAAGYDIRRLAKGYAVPEPLVSSDDPDAFDAALLPTVAAALDAEIEKNGQAGLLADMEIPLALVLADMEREGFAVDKEGIENFGKTLETRINGAASDIFDMVGYEFNLNSPKQLGEALFGKLGLNAVKKTKTGYSTNAEVLEALSGEHPVIDLILEYRTLAKLKSTYCDGLVKVIGEDGRIHSTLKQTETRTGRISSTEPNLQNIPIRSELGRELRRFFRAKEGCVLVDADYSQIELRVLAHIADDEVMINAFNEEQDIHAITASQVFNIPLPMVTPLMRSRAKAVNFGIVYGIGAFSLAKDIKVTRAEADRYIKGYLSHFSGVREYMKRIVEDAKAKGYVETMFKRRRYLPELSSSNAAMRAFGERVALNMPIQGTAADLIKIAMVRVHKRLESENLKAKLILQVHDELIVEAPVEEADRVAEILDYEMENAVKLRVRLAADVHSGKTWFDAKG